MPRHGKLTGSRGYWTLLQRAGVGLLVAALATLGFMATAGAAGPASGDIVSNAAQAQSPFTAGIPFASGQNISVVIPANSAFVAPNNTHAVNIVECSAPNGVIPTNTTSCDGNTIQGNSILPAADGSFTYLDYTLYALPNSVSLGESGSGVACGQTVATECILYIGNDQNDFTKPHLWSAPFFIAPNATDNGAPAGDGSPPPAPSVPDAGVSTVVASPGTATANGVDSSTVTVTLLDAHSVPVSGKAVTLSASTCSPSPCAAHISGPSSAQSDANGQTTFSVTDAVAQSVTLSGVDTTDSVSVTNTAHVDFAAPVVSATHSTVSASPTTVPSGSTTITVTLRDQAANPQPVAGHSVTLAATGSAVITPSTPQVTASSGVVTFTATDAQAETVTFSATDTTQSTVISNKATVTFGTLVVSPSISTVTVSSPAPLGSKGTTAVVTLLTSTGSPVAGKDVSLQASAGTSVSIGSPTPAQTGADGKVSFALTDSVAETAKLTANDTTDGVTLSAQPSVTFRMGLPRRRPPTSRPPRRPLRRTVRLSP